MLGTRRDGSQHAARSRRGGNQGADRAAGVGALRAGQRGRESQPQKVSRGVERAREVRGVPAGMDGNAMSEASVHYSVVQHLRWRAKSGVLWLHVPNGEARNK